MLKPTFFGGEGAGATGDGSASAIICGRAGGLTVAVSPRGFSWDRAGWLSRCAYGGLAGPGSASADSGSGGLTWASANRSIKASVRASSLGDGGKSMRGALAAVLS